MRKTPFRRLLSLHNPSTKQRDIIKTSHSALKFRIYPTTERNSQLNEAYGASRFVYNSLLAQNQEAYQQWKAGTTFERPIWNYVKQANKLPELKTEYDFLKAAHSQVLQASVKSLDNAFQALFNGDTKPPKFKKRKNGGSIHYPQNAKVDFQAGTVKLPKFQEPIKMIVHRMPDNISHYTVSSVVISKDADGRQYASLNLRKSTVQSSFLSKRNKAKRKPISGNIKGDIEHLPDNIKQSDVLGIDIGLKDLITTSDGYKIPMPKFHKIRRILTSIRSKEFSRKQDGSNNKKKARLRLAKTKSKTDRKKKDYYNSTLWVYPRPLGRIKTIRI